MRGVTAVAAIAAKDLRLLLRDRGAFVFTFLFPIAIAMFFGYIFGGGRDEDEQEIVLAVYDADGGSAARAYVAALTAPGEGLAASRTDSVEACEARVRSREALACLLLPAGFAGGIEGMLAGKPATLEVVVDPSRKAETGLLTGKLMASGFRQLGAGFADPAGMAGLLARARATLAAEPNVPATTRAALEQLYGGLDGLVQPADQVSSGTGPEGQAGWQPLHIATRALQARRADGPPSSFAVSFPQGVVWGLMSCVMAFISALIRERSRGTMLRLTAAPISAAQVLAGKSLACFTCCVAVQALIVAVGALGFGVAVGSPGKLVVAVLAASLGFTGLTLLMAGLSRSEEGADGLGRAALIVLAMIGGGAIPLAFMPAAMLTLSHFSPFKWALLAFEGALWRGFGWAEMLLPCAILGGVAIAGFVLGTLLLRRMRVE
jgi:ABC-2 type transport system permease protein